MLRIARLSSKRKKFWTKSDRIPQSRISSRDVGIPLSVANWSYGVSWVIPKNPKWEKPFLVKTQFKYIFFCPDVPRGRLVKYPLLLKSIRKYTPEGHSDHVLLQEAIEIVEDTIKLVDARTGLAKCEFVKSQLDFLSDDRVSC